MEAILYILLAATAGAVITHLIHKVKNQALVTELLIIKDQLKQESVQKEKLLEENIGLNAGNESLAKEIALLHEQMSREQDERNKRFAEQLKMMQEQLKSSTQELLKQREEELSKTNTHQMGTIITPLKEKIEEMKTAMDSSRDSHTKTTASLEKAIEEVMKRTTEIGSEADKLAQALRNENKTQGNWGEIILNELLESQGLKEGIHYEQQVTMRDNTGKAILNDESGKRMIPDVILHYPDGKDAIIDSKVSLSAFIDFQHAEEEQERESALKRHLTSIRQHVTELYRKDYSSYIKAPRQGLNYVIMFVPNESALQLALYNDSTLWRDSFEKGVFITSEQNLIAALRMIQIAWTQVQQAQNQETVFKLVNQLLDRMGDFIKLFEETGRKIEALSVTYTSTKKKLYAGQQSLLGPANKLVQLGGKINPQKPIPAVKEEYLVE